MKLKILRTLGVLLLIGSVFWWYVQMGPYRMNTVKKIIREFPPVEQTLEAKDLPVTSTLPAVAPSDLVIQYEKGGGMIKDETVFYISNNKSTLKREYKADDGDDMKKEWDLKLSQKDVQGIYEIFRTRGFDSMKSRQLKEDETIYDDGRIRMTLSYSENGKQVKYDLLNNGSNQVLDEYADRWLNLIQICSYMAEVYRDKGFIKTLLEWNTMMK